jgi:hypothetical protein
MIGYRVYCFETNPNHIDPICIEYSTPYCLIQEDTEVDSVEHLHRFNIEYKTVERVNALYSP